MLYQKLTEEDIRAARSYVPIMEKHEIAERVGQLCFDQLAVTAGTGMPLPPMYKENPQLKARYLMGIFVGRYLQKPFDGVDGDPDLLAADDYDRWAGGHIFNQLARMKHSSDSDIRNKVFDILDDYRSLEKMVSSVISGMLRVMNDQVNRFIPAMRESTSPEALQEAKAELRKLQGELAEAANRRRKGTS